MAGQKDSKGIIVGLSNRPMLKKQRRFGRFRTAAEWKLDSAEELSGAASPKGYRDDRSDRKNRRLVPVDGQWSRAAPAVSSESGPRQGVCRAIFDCKPGPDYFVIPWMLLDALS